MQNYKNHAYVISMEYLAVNRRRPSCETPLGPGAKKDGCFRRLTQMAYYLHLAKPKSGTPEARFSKVPKAFRIRKAVAKSQSS